MAATSIPLPPPYKGQNVQYPEFSIQNPNCIEMDNFHNRQGVAKTRNGNTNFARTATTSFSYNLSSYGDSALFLLVTRGGVYEWYDITAGGAGVLVHSLLVGSAGRVQTLFFNEYLFYFLGGAVASQCYNGTVWGATGYVWPSVTFFPAGGEVYKGRAYIIDRGGTSYAYTEPNAISGTTYEVDLAQYVSSSAQLFAIRSISMSQNVTQENVLAFVFSTGEILVYSGSYPDSANWVVIARFKVSAILDTNSFVSAKGDTFLLTRTEILSLRNLFVGGYDKERAEGIGASIQNRWSQIVSALLTWNLGAQYLIKSVYDEKKDRIVITLPKYVSRTGAVVDNVAFQLIYDFVLGAWYEYYQYADAGAWGYVTSCAYHNGDVYLVGDHTVLGAAATTTLKLEGNSGFTDDSISVPVTSTAITYNLKSAPHPLSRNGVVKTETLEMIVKTDMAAQVAVRLIGDLGAIVSEFQKSTVNGTNVTNALYDVGIESNLVQYQVNFNSSTITPASTGLTIYGTNLWVNPSDSMSR